MELRPGLSISNNVRLVRLLGEGGMGSVWVADHLTLDTQVAVKFISAALSNNEEAVARFTREATSAARIRSPHVVQILDHGVFHGLPYIVMEMLQGEDLDARLARQGTLSLAETLTILQQVCKALSDAHALGIIHRDIKPPNIFLTQSADEIFVKLLDFGIAKTNDPGSGMRMTVTGQAVGTPAYMSPEQLFSNAGDVDHRSDLWSLAVLVHECVTGVLPFDGSTLGDLSLSIHRGDFAPPSRRRPGLTPALDAWFKRALDRNPDGRFGSARELFYTFAEAVSPPGYRAPMLSDAMGSLPSFPFPEGPSLLGGRPSFPEGPSLLGGRPSFPAGLSPLPGSTLASALSAGAGVPFVPGRLPPPVAPTAVAAASARRAAQTLAGTTAAWRGRVAPRRSVGVIIGATLGLVSVVALVIAVLGRSPPPGSLHAEAAPAAAGPAASQAAPAAAPPAPPAAPAATPAAPPGSAAAPESPRITPGAPATAPTASTKPRPAAHPAPATAAPAAPASTATPKRRNDHGF